MTSDEVFQKLQACGTSPEGARRVLTYASWAQLSGGWANLFIPGANDFGSEGEKGRAMDILRKAGVDPMAVSFPEPLRGSPLFPGL